MAGLKNHGSVRCVGTALFWLQLSVSAAVAQSSSLPAFPGEGKVELLSGEESSLSGKPGQVLEAVYGERGDVDGFDLSNRRWAAFWFGQTFVLNGETFFAGFVADSPAEGADSDGSDMPKPPIGIGQASYKQTPQGWTNLSTGRNIGQLFPGGAGGNAPLIDDEREPKAVAPSKSRMILAVPTVYSVGQGAQISGYEIMAFDATSGQWRYAGSINAGFDNAAGCDDAGAMKCISNIGAIAMLPANPMSWGRWPIIRITFTGTVAGEAGAARAATDRDAVDYMFDESRGSYAMKPADAGAVQ